MENRLIKILEEQGGSKNICLQNPLVCMAAPDDMGKYQMAVCGMMGLSACYDAGEAFKDAQELAGEPALGKNGKPDVFDPKWNAKHHATWMALMVTKGIDPEIARLLGYAHELDAQWTTGAPGLGSVDSRIDLANNEAGIRIGMNALKSTAA